MNSILETIPQLILYQTSIMVLVILCLIVLLQSFLSAPLAFVKEEQVPGAPLRGGHAQLSFRVIRTYANSVENFPAFGWSLFVAVIVGVDPETVNWLAIAYLAFRVGFWGVYYVGIGKPAGGPRTMCYVGGLLSNTVLAVTALMQLM